MDDNDFKLLLKPCSTYHMMAPVDRAGVQLGTSSGHLSLPCVAEQLGRYGRPFLHSMEGDCRLCDAVHGKISCKVSVFGRKDLPLYPCHDLSRRYIFPASYLPKLSKTALYGMDTAPLVSS